MNCTPAALVVLWKQFNERGHLLRKWINTKDPDTRRSLIVVPESLTEKIMEIFQKSIMSSHPGVERSLHQRRHFSTGQKCSWTSLSTSLHVQHAMRLSKLITSYMLLSSNSFSTTSTTTIVVDHIVPEQEGRTPCGFRCILTITDSFSNYLVAVPVKTRTSKDNLKAIFRKWVLTFGMPKKIMVNISQMCLKPLIVRKHTALFTRADPLAELKTLTNTKIKH